MQPLRFNPFGQIHKGLRALLYDSALLLQKTDFTIEEQVTPVLERIHLVNTLFEHHAHVEDSEIFPMIAEYAPQLVVDFEAQHVTDHELSARLSKTADQLAQSTMATERLIFGNELLQEFGAFLAFNVEHMRKEETVICNCLWQYYSDAELLQKVEQISGSIPPEQNKHFIFWMLRGMSPNEIIVWYEHLQSNVPDHIFEFFIETAKAALPVYLFSLLKEHLHQSELVK